jgi:hypothetical protein
VFVKLARTTSALMQRSSSIKADIPAAAGQYPLALVSEMSFHITGGIANGCKQGGNGGAGFSEDIWT